MIRVALLNGLRVIIALAVMMSASPFLRAAPAMHDVGTSQVVEGLKASDLSGQIGHGHSHDDDDLDPGHRADHGLEHKDHSHVTLGLAAPPTSLIGPVGKVLRKHEQCRSSTDLLFPLDRPPCPVFAA
jgi:hypothetical protein